jgi:succinate-semialdehyde dehydrogenase/glutarate-semialdehyde dehydrogenase
MADTKFQLFIAGDWTDGSDGRSEPVLNPATEQPIGTLAHASPQDLDRALASAEAGLAEWSAISAWERGAILRRAADILRQRKEELGRIMTLEQGKPLAQAIGEVDRAADFMEWGGEEGRRVAARTYPARDGVSQVMVDRLPIGVVAAFTPWNFPMVLAAKKLGAALGAGCSCIVKPAEETPGSGIELVRALIDAGVPANAVNLVFGVPAEVSSHLIPSPIVRKVTFTGSVPVGKLLASMAGQHMKPVTMELGGHSPVIVFDDVDVGRAADALVGQKFFNAGQVCIAPTRFMVQDTVYDEFVERFVAGAKNVSVGDGFDPDTQMGPMANERRVTAMEEMIADARDHGAEVHTGGNRIGNQGYFFEPTVLTGVPREARMMTVEPFGPVAPITPFSDPDQALEAANGVDYALASYVFSNRPDRREKFMAGLNSGVVGVNGVPAHFPEIPLGGWDDSGYGVEGGIEALEPYLKNKFVNIKDL